MIPLLTAVALAQDPAVTAEVHGNAKTFFLATFPYENELLMPPGPYGQGVASGRVAFAGNPKQPDTVADQDVVEGVVQRAKKRATASAVVGFSHLGSYAIDQAVGPAIVSCKGLELRFSCRDPPVAESS